MNSTFIVSYAALWVVVLVLVLMVLLLYREHGLAMLDNRERIDLYGLDVGKNLGTLDRELAAIAEALAAEEALLLFTSDRCPVCQELAPEASDLAINTSEIEFYWISETDSGSSDPHAPFGWNTVAADRADENNLHATMQVPVTPFCYFVRRGVITAKGLVNSAADIVDLMAPTAREGDRNE